MSAEHFSGLLAIITVCVILGMDFARRWESMPAPFASLMQKDAGLRTALCAPFLLVGPTSILVRYFGAEQVRSLADVLYLLIAAGAILVCIGCATYLITFRVRYRAWL